MIYNLVVIGAGPAGLFSAISYKTISPETSVTVLDQNELLGSKFKITGGGRCNITNSSHANSIHKYYGKSSSFLKTALGKFSPQILLKWFEERGVIFVEEQKGKVYPQNKNAKTLYDLLLLEAQKLKIEIVSNIKIKSVIKEQHNQFSISTAKNNLRCEKIVFACGGKSYPSTGSDGSGYELASSLGHSITPLYPMLTPLYLSEVEQLKHLAGLSVSEGRASFYIENKKLEVCGEILITHKGISGPAILNFSEHISKYYAKSNSHTNPIRLDIYPYQWKMELSSSAKEIDDILIKEFQLSGKKLLHNVLHSLCNARLVDVIIDRIKRIKEYEEIAFEELKVCECNSALRKQLATFLYALPFQVVGCGDYQKAMVTCGGVNLCEINKETMESMICENLYFAGEILDIQGPTGGYNLQAAFSTGYLAGKSAAKKQVF